MLQPTSQLTLQSEEGHCRHAGSGSAGIGAVLARVGQSAGGRAASATDLAEAVSDATTSQKLVFAALGSPRPHRKSTFPKATSALPAAKGLTGPAKAQFAHAHLHIP